MRVGSLFSCKKCSEYFDEVRRLQSSLHLVELEMVRWKTLAEERFLEIDRLSRASENRTLPHQGGFVTSMSPSETSAEEMPAVSDASSFAQRIDEVYGVGLPSDELMRRQESYKIRLVNELQEERTAIAQELQRIP